MSSRPSLRALAAFLAAALPLASCQTQPSGAAPEAAHGVPVTAAPPARRHAGPRLPPPFAGRDPAGLGLAKVEGLLWLAADDVATWNTGGRGIQPDPSAGPGAGLTLRTDHVLLTTDLPASEALGLARLAQSQVEMLLQRYGEPLDLRLPLEPLQVRVFRRRADFAAALQARTGTSHGWNAYYDVGDAVVRVSAEPAADAPLPLSADLRHELTHAVIDRSAPQVLPHERIVRGHHFWLWEAVAVSSEDLGEPAPGAAYRVREARFRERFARRELPTIAQYLALPQARFEGRHYDMTAVWMRFLLGDPVLGPRTLDLLRRLLAGDRLQPDPATEWGLAPDELERRWRAHLARTFPGLGG